VAPGEGAGDEDPPNRSERNRSPGGDRAGHCPAGGSGRRGGGHRAGRHATPKAPNRLVLRARHTGLPDFDSGVFSTVVFWIDVDRADHGPEFVVDVIPNAGGMRLLSVEGWNRGDRRFQPCQGMRARADVFTDGPVTLSVPRSCLDDPARVRGAVKAVGETPRGEVVGRDWVGGRRHWSPWLRS
jgi:hypothetical protein